MEKSDFFSRPQRLAIVIVGLALLLAAIPVSVSAQDASTLTAGEPTGDQYLDTVTRISTSTSTPSMPARGALPFTGFDIGIVALVGAALLGLGLTIRRVGSRGIDA